jgi:MFS family permease
MMTTSTKETPNLDPETAGHDTDIPDSTPAENAPYSIFTPKQKALIVFLVSWAATFSGFSGNIYFPAIPTIASDLSVSTELVNITVTTYLIFQGLSPSIWGAIADVKGRRVTYICTFAVYLGACIGLAKTRHYYQLVILRCLQSAGSASTIALGAGVVGDITTREERGGYMGIYQMGCLVPVSVGPVIGGALAGTLGWRSIFWFLTIFGACFLVLLVVFLPETLRSLVGNGSVPVRGIANSILSVVQRRRNGGGMSVQVVNGKKARPDLLSSLKMIGEKQVSFMIIFAAIYYMVWQMIVTVMSSLFKRTYSLTEIQIGLTFIGNGVGCMLGTLLTGRFLDYDYRRLMEKHINDRKHIKDFPLEHARLRSMWLYAGLQCASTLVFGWTIAHRVHISVPVIATFVLGWSATSILSTATTFMVDIFHTQSASATAALNLARCLLGAGGIVAVLPLADVIGVGWTFTLFTGVMLISLFLLFVQMTHGARWRLASIERLEGDG